MQRVRSITSTVLVLALASACGPPQGDGSGDASAASTGPADAGTGDATPTTGGSDSGETGETGVADGPTYYQDIAPVLNQRCNGCHVAGGIAPFALTSFAEVSPFAQLILDSVTRGAMPPWPPGPDTPPLLHDRSLPADELALLTAWVEAGASEGDASQPAPLHQPEVIDIGATDLEVDIGTDYVPDEGLTDDYHCFAIDLGLTDDRVATGYRFTPGNGKTVHHVVTSMFDADSLAAIAALDAETPDVVGWPCFGGVSNIPGATASGGLGSWVPGVSAVAYPEGTGNPIDAGTIVVLQIHYNLAGGTDPDRTRLELAFAPPESQASLIPLRAIPLLQHKLEIQAGEADIVATQSLTAKQWMKGKFFADGEGFILGAAGHMHLLGTEVTLTLTDKDGARTLLDIPAWDFHWQGTYNHVTPIAVHPDDVLAIRCVYDNTAQHRSEQGMGPPVDVKWGEGTQDEMCLGSLSVVDDLPDSP